jgi:hypothetical protein
MIPPAHPTASLCVPALVTGNQIDGGFYKGFFRSLLNDMMLHEHNKQKNFDNGPAITRGGSDRVIAHPPSGCIKIMFIKWLSIQTSSEPILSILERSAWVGIRGRVLK